MIRGLAERALAGPTDPMVLEWGAMGLALLGDDNGLGHVRVLAALHRYLYDRGVAAVDAETLAMIRGLAERALAGPTDPMVLEWGAMGLALLVGGPELRAAVEEMATSDEAVRKRLFFPAAWDRWRTDYEPEYIERIRKEANYLLADPKRTPYYQRPGCGGSQTGFDLVAVAGGHALVK